MVLTMYRKKRTEEWFAGRRSRRWNEIPVSKFQDCINAAGNTHNIQKKAKNVVSGMATFAIKQGWCKENNPKYCSVIKEEDAYKEVFEPEEVRTLWAFTMEKYHYH